MARKTEKADTLDKHIGNRIKEQRENSGMTQAELAQKIGVSYQQIHKYERGTNRISAGRLGMIADVLGKDAQYFYEGFYSETTGLIAQVSENNDSRLYLQVARHFRQIDNIYYQEAIYSLIRTLAEK